ncbi:MAG: SDR family oxidoreductase, partial [SAR202 cluster bacterium]|nr:SDR family oxidoreductase [SAR202 cluster bacterium]
MGSRLENKVAIVTGGASGIGEAISKIFFDEGASVCIIDTNNEKLRLLEEKISSKEKIITRNFDVSDEKSWKECVDTILKKWDKIDILVNNAGMSLRSTFEDMERSDWDRVFAVNSTSVM